jgi:transposase-like protein
MTKTHLSAEEIIEKLRRADALLHRGKKVAEVVGALGITSVAYYRWRREYGGMSAAQAKRLRALALENKKLRKTVADLTLDKLILQQAARQRF